jgi:small nuclear ribonucleoprotein (snRNP)-like protein
MSEILNKRLKESKNKNVIIFLKNGFRFEGKLLNFDEIYVEILDRKLNDIKVIEIEKISELNLVKDKI